MIIAESPVRDIISVTYCGVSAFELQHELLKSGRRSIAATWALESTRNEGFAMNKRLRKALEGLGDPDMERRRRAMEPFVRETFQSFIRYLYRYLGNEVECEDVLEDVYADIWENPDRLKNVTNDKELLRTTYMYYMRKRLRQVYRRLNRNLCLPQNDLMNLMAPELGTLETVSQAELKDVLHKALGKLKSRERRAIELWMNGMSIRAIANELNTTVGAVKMLKFRTLLKLKKLLGGYCSPE